MTPVKSQHMRGPDWLPQFLQPHHKMDAKEPQVLVSVNFRVEQGTPGSSASRTEGPPWGRRSIKLSPTSARLTHRVLPAIKGCGEVKEAAFLFGPNALRHLPLTRVTRHRL